MDSNVLLENIRNLCKKNNVSITRLESDLFLSPGLISRWNKNMPSLDKIIDIADYFGVSLDDLAGRAKSESPLSNAGRFILLLYKRSINADISWEILNCHTLPKEFESVTFPKDFLSGSCYYTSYRNGFFFLLAVHDSDSQLRLSLHILPDIHSRFECVPSETGHLMQLYKYLDRRFSRQMNTMKSDNLINAFIQEETDAGMPNDEKITPLRGITEASSY